MLRSPRLEPETAGNAGTWRGWEEESREEFLAVPGGGAAGRRGPARRPDPGGLRWGGPAGDRRRRWGCGAQRVQLVRVHARLGPGQIRRRVRGAGELRRLFIERRVAGEAAG